jgi:hypothetical protein
MRPIVIGAHAARTNAAINRAVVDIVFMRILSHPDAAGSAWVFRKIGPAIERPECFGYTRYGYTKGSHA